MLSPEYPIAGKELRELFPPFSQMLQKAVQNILTLVSWKTITADTEYPDVFYDKYETKTTVYSKVKFGDDSDEMKSRTDEKKSYCVTAEALYGPEELPGFVKVGNPEIAVRFHYWIALKDLSTKTLLALGKFPCNPKVRELCGGVRVQRAQRARERVAHDTFRERGARGARQGPNQGSFSGQLAAHPRQGGADEE